MRNHKIRVFIADDHKLVTAGFVSLIEDQPDMEVVGTAETGEGLLSTVINTRANVLVLDLAMPHFDRLSFIETACGNPYWRAGILVVSAQLDRTLIAQLEELAVAGYMLKEESASLLTASIRIIHDGGTAYSRMITEAIIRPTPPPQHLSAHEIQLIRHLSHGKTAREIAPLLDVEEYKVNYTIRRLKVSLDAKTHAELVGNALRMRYVTLGDLE